MKLINKTKYATGLLRSILCAVHTKQSTWGRGRLRTWDRLRITVVYGRKSPYSTVALSDTMISGRATYDGLRMRLCVPPGTVDVAAFVLVARHELWHNYGIRHADYPISVMKCDPANPANAEWVQEFVRFGNALIEVEKKIDNRQDGACTFGLDSA